MSNIKYMVGSGLVSAGLATIILFSDPGEAYAQSRTPKDLPGGKASVTLSDDLKTTIEQKKRIGQHVVEELKGEFDKVMYHIFENKTKVKTDGKIYFDLVIRAFEVDEVGDWPYWAINLDSMCRSIVEENKFLFFDISDYLIVEDNMGNVIKSPENFKHSVAEQLNKIVENYYLGNNAERCKYWVKFYQENMGPLGPAK